MASESNYIFVSGTWRIENIKALTILKYLCMLPEE